MPPKKSDNPSNKRPRVDREAKNKGKATTSSSTQPIQWKKHFTFTNKDQYSNFIEHFSHLEIITPRFLPRTYVEEKGYNTLLRALLDGNWFEFLGKEIPYIQEDLIRMFYANMAKESSSDHDGDILYTIVNGTRIDLTDELIHEVSGLSMTPTIRMNYNEQTFLTSWGVQPYTQRPTIIGMTNNEGRLLVYLSIYNIHPRISSRSKITQDDSFVMFNLLHNQHFNWCDFIKHNMGFISTNREALGYAPLIMEILKHVGIKTNLPNLTASTATWKISDKTFKNKSSSRTTSIPPHHPTSNDQIDLSKVQLRDLAKSLNSLHFKMDNVMGRMSGIESFLTSKFGYPEPSQNVEFAIIPSGEGERAQEDPYTDEEV